MSNVLDGLLAKIDDPALKAAIAGEVERLRDTKQFGLVFERHLPETAKLANHPVRRGALVQRRAQGEQPNGTVTSVLNGKAAVAWEDGESEQVPTDELLVVARFGEPIYPGLTSLGRVESGGDKPFHAVINAENYHALQMLQFTHRGKVDVIYIDPPYNSGARDWKYNNAYVDENDAYRHSKWLSFMDRRLRLAYSLLNPNASALIVTIDEKEIGHLRVLLDQVFPNGQIQVVSSVINPKGVVRDNQFSRTDEYVIFVLMGKMRLKGEAQEETAGQPVHWQQFRRTDIASRRGTKKGGKQQFYPLYVNTQTNRIEHVGEPLQPDVERTTAPSRPGCVAVFPVRDDGTEMNWGLTPASAKRLLKRGFLRARSFKADKPQPFTVQYLTSGRVKDVDEGRALVTETDASGAAVVIYRDDATQRKMATTTWNRPSHNAQYYGSDLVAALLPGRSFPFPKSLYAVEDALWFLVEDDPDAVILDFFAGSGTTAHAVARLNQRDGGRRTSLLVTNNELSEDDAKQLAAQNKRPGDADWEDRGIFRSVTKPRVEAAVTGLTPDGEPVVGSYRFNGEASISEGLAENVEFFGLTHQDPNRVARGRAYTDVAPLLWLATGGTGPRINDTSDSYAMPDGAVYAVLFDPAYIRDLVADLDGRDEVETVYVVTDSTAVYQQAAAELPAHVEPVRLYEAYLRNFEINTGDDL